MRVERNDLRPAPGLRSDLLHNAGTNGCHLRTVVRTGDGSNRIAAEGGTGHKKLIVLLLTVCGGIDGEITNLKRSTVRGQTGRNTSGNGRTKVTANGSRSNQEDLRLKFFNHCREGLRVWLCAIGLKLGIIDKNYLVSPVLAQFIRQISHMRSKQNCGDFLVQICRQLPGLAQKLQRNI